MGAVDRVGDDVTSLQEQVEDLQVQLSRSQALVLSLQARFQDATPNSTPKKSNWEDKELQELVTRVSSLEEQMRKGKGHAEEEKAKSMTRTGWVIDAHVEADGIRLIGVIVKCAQKFGNSFVPLF